MSRKTAEPTIDHSRVELDGVRYVILRENVFAQLCKKAKIPLDDSSPSSDGGSGLRSGSAVISTEVGAAAAGVGAFAGGIGTSGRHSAGNAQPH